MRNLDNLLVPLVIVGLTAVHFCAPGKSAANEEWTSAEQDIGYVVFEHSPMNNLSASHVPAPEDVTQQLSCTLARDEYESVQLGVHALAGGLQSIEVDVESELEAIVYHRISPKFKAEFASAPVDTGEISGWVPAEIHLQRGNVFAELASGESVNFWITVHADRLTRPGLHRGKIRIKPSGRPATELQLLVTVRPFRLGRPRVSFGAWMREDMLPIRFGRLDTPSETVLRIYRDMAAHGHNSVWFYPVAEFKTLPPTRNHWLDKLMPLAERAGILDPHVPCLMVGGITTDLDDQQREAAAQWLLGEISNRNWPEIVAFGPDEPKYPHDDIMVRESVAALGGLPIRLNLDQSSVAATYGYSTPGLCDVHNVMDGCVSPEMIAEIERGGGEVWTYSYRMWREDFLPLRQRFFAGLYTWVHHMGGNWIWAYHHGHHRHAWFPPSSQEPMPVTGWETRREGIDDYRYLQMVEDCVQANPDNPLATEAKAWLAELRNRLASVVPNLVEAGKPLTIDEYDEIRARAAGYIEKLGPVPNESITRTTSGQVRDEAAAYRGKSVAECIAGLGSADASERRAAAWALFELGPAAAAAVQPLARLLDDPEVRFPALHALEAMGADAHPAVPQLAKLLEHPDFFVRTGAVQVLGEIGCTVDQRIRTGRRYPTPHAALVAEPLRKAYDDDFEPLACEAGEMLAALEQWAAPAVPEAIARLEHPSYLRRISGLGFLTSLGPFAAPAVPKLIELHREQPKYAPYIDLFAAIGPAATAAIPVLEQYAAKHKGGPEEATAYYTLECIRGEQSDLRKLVALLQAADGNTDTKDRVVMLLNKLGANADAVTDEIRQMVASGEYSQWEEGLQTFLQTAAKGEVPGTHYEW
jgi:hypothetical protein